jgi:HK97 family phage prohead protease
MGKRITGYASTFGNIDRVGDVVMKGAFQKTIAERLPTGKIKLMSKHFAYGGDGLETVGTVDVLREDSKGLYFEADIAETDHAQEIYKLAKGGHLSASSIGYSVVDGGPGVVEGKEAFEIREAKLFEITLTNNPANEMATHITAKSADILDALNSNDSSATVDRIEALGGKDKAIDLAKSLGEMAKAIAGMVGNDENAEDKEDLTSKTDDKPEAKAVDADSLRREIAARKQKIKLSSL